MIIPNHVHILLSYNSPKTLNNFVGNGKRFIAYEIVERLKQANNKELLETLRSGVNKSDNKKGALHQVFEESFEAKLCFSKKFIQQKLNYIHNNPCAKKWMLAVDPVSYLHSSALYYETGKQGIWGCNSWTEHLDSSLLL